MPSMETEKSNISQAEEIKFLANEAFKGNDNYAFRHSLIFNLEVFSPSEKRVIGSTINLLLYTHGKAMLPLSSSTMLTGFFFPSTAHKFSQAIALYTQAIELNSQSAVYWANRAFAHTKLEEYGSALLDASEAIKIDPKYSKACFAI